MTALAIYNPPPTLAAVGTVSFKTEDVSALGIFLIGFGYDAEPSRSPHEWARFWFLGSLIVVYNNGTALVQGKPEPSMALLTGLCEGGAL